MASSSSALLNWRPSTPFYYGWLVLGLSGAGAFAATVVAGVVLGGIQILVAEDTGWPRSWIGYSASCGVLMSGVFAPFAGRLADRYGPRWLMPVGLIALGLSMLAFGWVHMAWQFFIAAVIARAVSQPFLIGVVPRTMAVNFFNRRRNIALACTGMYRPISAAAIIPAFSAITLLADWRTAFRIFGVFSLVLVIPMIIVMRRRPEDIGLLPDGARAQSTGDQHAQAGTTRGRPQESRATTTEAGTTEVSWTSKEAMRSRAFWMVSIVAFLNVSGSSGLGFSLVPYLHEFAGLTTIQATGVLSVSTFLALSSLVWGQVASKVTPRWCVIAAMGVSALATLALFQVNGLVAAYAFGVFWGLFHSALEVLLYMVLADYFGRNSYGAIAGAMRPFEAGGLALGQIVGPVVYDLTGSYVILIFFSATVQAMAMCLMILARRPEARPPLVAQTA